MPTYRVQIRREIVQMEHYLVIAENEDDAFEIALEEDFQPEAKDEISNEWESQGVWQID